MAFSTADVAISQANQIFSMMTQLRQLRDQVVDIVLLNTVSPFGNRWNALKTVAVNADGTLGSADANPVPDNPINPALYAAIQRVVKATDLAAALQCLVDFQAFCAGTALVANAARPAQITVVTQM